MLITLHLLPLMIWVSILTWRNAGCSQRRKL